MLPVSSVESQASFAVGPMDSIVLIAGFFVVTVALRRGPGIGILAGRTDRAELYLGLRVYQACGKHAVHRILFCPAPDEDV